MAKGMTTKQAFEKIINDADYRKSLPVEDQRSIASYKSLYNQGKLPLTRIDAFLEKHGFTVVQERLWSKPKTNK